MWQIINQHKQEDGETIALELRDSNRSLDANVRWDGCMEIHLYSKTEENVEQFDTIRTCDIDQLILRLQELKNICQEFFDYQGYWKQGGDDYEI